jgi:6-phosphogluconolactonase
VGQLSPWRHFAGTGEAAFAWFAFCIHFSTSVMASSHLIYFGTYSRNTPSQGIYSARLDGATGALSQPELAAVATDPSWLTLSPDGRRLYAIHGSAAQAIGFSVDATTGKLTPLAASAPAPDAPPVNPPSHLVVDATGRALLAANFRDGFVASIPIHADGSLGTAQVIRHAGRGAHPTRQDKPHVHSVTLSPDNRFVIVADLGLDRVFTYALDAATARLTPASPPWIATAPGAGPRHSKFGADGRFVYVINELDNTLDTFAYEATCGALSRKQTVPTLPSDFSGTNTTAEVRIHPNGRFLYGSNRGHDSVAVFAIDPALGTLTRVEIVPSGGRNPRNFALSPDGRWLVCGHQDTPLVTVFRVDPTTGRLTRTEHSAAVPAAVCVLFWP